MGGTYPCRPVQRGYQRARNQPAKRQSVYVQMRMDDVEFALGCPLHARADVQLLQHATIRRAFEQAGARRITPPLAVQADGGGDPAIPRGTDDLGGLRRRGPPTP